MEQTELGFVFAPGDNGYGQNRGCMSQWGARCLENENGADYMDILRFYYGEDIQVVQADGECVLPVDTTDGTASDSAGDETGSTSADASDTAEPTTDPTADASAGDESSGGVGGTEGSDPSGGGDDSVGEGGNLTAGADGSSGGGRGSNGALPDGFGEGADAGGCGCASGDDGDAPFGVALFAVGLFGLRRLRR